MHSSSIDLDRARICNFFKPIAAGEFLFIILTNPYLQQMPTEQVSQEQQAQCQMKVMSPDERIKIIQGII